MKILLVTDQFFAANNGMTISGRRFAKVLEEHGNQVRIVSTGSVGDTEYLMKTFKMPFFDKLVSSQGMRFAKPDDDVLREAVAWADVVHFLVPFALSRHALMIARDLGVPYTGAFHVQPENITSSIYMERLGFVNSFIYAWFRHYIFKFCPHIHCPSRFIAGQLEKHGYKSALHVISNGIDPDFKYRKIPKTPALEGRFVILSVGRLSREKRQDVIIRAAAKSRYKDRIKLMLAGQGPKKEKIAALAAKMGVDTDIRFYSKSDLLDLIAMSDLYVHAADAEIEAMACMEAFAGGLVPVIADSPKSATPQFALDGRSLFKANDPEDLARRIDYWIEHEDERKRMEQEYAASAGKYSLDDCVRQAEDMFRLAIDEVRGGENGGGQEDDRIVRLPEPFKFQVDGNYDYLRKGALKTAWYVAMRVIVDIILNIYDRLMFGLKINGAKNLKEVRKTGAMIVCNHVHTMDCTFIDCAIPLRRVYYTTLESNFRIPVARHFIRWLGGVPIPTKICELKDFTAEMKRALESGNFVCMYPEGVLYPYYNGLRDFKNGAFKLAAMAKSPVVPLVITYRKPRGVYRLYKHKPCITLNVLKPVYPEDGAGTGETARSFRDSCYEQMSSAMSD